MTGGERATGSDERTRPPLDDLARVAGWLEGVSFPLLMLVAMPLKYLAAEPRPVMALGGAHGALFTLFAVLVALAAHQGRWSAGRLAWAAAAAVMPFGPFLLDRRVFPK